MMKILCAIAVATAFLAATVHAAPGTSTPSLDTWQVANLHDVTQAWYFTGEALAVHDHDGAPWAADRPLFRPADAALAPPPSPAVLAKIDMPPTIPEPPMASMLLVGAVLIFLRIGRKEDQLG